MTARRRPTHRAHPGSGSVLLVGVLAAGMWWLHIAGPGLSSWPALAAITAPSAVAVADIPAGYLALYRRAGGTCPGLDWALLAGVGKAETDHGRAPLPGVRSGTNSAGAAGPMQFLLPTWAQVRRTHPDVGPNIYDPAAAIPAAAHYLCDNDLTDRGARAALWGYNHSTVYADQVLTHAARYRRTGVE